MKLFDIIPNDPLLEDLSRRGFLKGAGAAAGMAAIPKIAFAANSESDIATGAKKLAWVAWEMKNRGYSSRQIKAGFINMPLVGKARDIGIEIADAVYDPKYSGMSQSQFQNAMVARFTVSRSPTKKSLSKQNDTETGNDQKSLRQDNLDRLRQAEPSASYIGRVKSRIAPNIRANPELQRFGEEGKVTVEIKMNKDGDILSQRIVQSSGFKRVDDAIIAAIQSTQVLPKDTDGRVPPTIKLNFEITSSSIN